MANFLSGALRPFGLDPSQGYDTAAAGAKDAQSQANALSDLQWQRQMQGLGQAQGYTNQLQSLYNSLYSPGGGQAAAGGMQSMGGPQMGGGGGQPGASMLLPKPAAPTAPAGGTGGGILNSPLTSIGMAKAIGNKVSPYTTPFLRNAGHAVEGAFNGLKGLF